MTAHLVVFGPGRPRAAYEAIAELEQAEDACAPWPTDAQLERVRKAREVRAQYDEYGDAAAALARCAR